MAGNGGNKMTEQTGTWEPDWEPLARMIQPLNDSSTVVYIRRAQEVIAEYRQQQAAQGRVEVRLDDLEAITYAPVNPNVDECVYDRLEAIVDAAHTIMEQD